MITGTVRAMQWHHLLLKNDGGKLNHSSLTWRLVSRDLVSIQPKSRKPLPVPGGVGREVPVHYCCPMRCKLSVCSDTTQSLCFLFVLFVCFLLNLWTKIIIVLRFDCRVLLSIDNVTMPTLNSVPNFTHSRLVTLFVLHAQLPGTTEEQQEMTSFVFHEHT